MLTLATTETLRGVAGSASAITYTLSGDEKGTTDGFKVLAQGQLAAAAGIIYLVPGAPVTATLMQRMFFRNVTAGNVTMALYVNGVAGTNQIFGATLPANGSASYGSDGWKIYDAAGVQQYVGAIGPMGATGPTGPTGPTGATGSPTTPDSITNAFLADMPANTMKGNFTAALDNPTDGALAANQLFARASAGDISAKTVTDAGLTWLTHVTIANQTAALDLATSTLKGLMSALDKKIVDNLHYDFVADFGGVGNDSTLNDTQFATAISTMPTGSTLFFPVGTYRISTEITISVDKKITFKGAGRYSTIIKTTSATANFFNINAVAWRNTWIDLGFLSTVNKTAGACIAITLGQAATFPTNTAVSNNVYRCWFSSDGGGTIFQAINFTGWQAGNLSVLADLDISGISNGGRGIFIFGSTINTMIHNVTINCGAATTSAPCEIQASGAVQVTACDWIQGTNGVLFNAATQLGAQACYFTNVFFDQPQGDVIKILGGFTTGRIKFTQCGIAPTGNNSAVNVAGTGAGAVGTATALPAGISIMDCDIYNAAGTGTGAGVLVNGCQDINIQNSRITGFGGAGGAGIRIIPSAGNVTKARITGNIFGPNSNLTVTNTIHIDLQAAGGSGLGDLSIADNQMTGATTAPLVDNSLAVLNVNKRITQNSGLMAGTGPMQTLNSGGAAVIVGRALATAGTVNSFLGTVRVPPNSVQVQQKFRVTLVTQSSAAGVPTFNIHLGATGTIASDPIICPIVLAAQAINGYQYVDALVEVIFLGASSTVVAHGQARGSVATGTTQTAAAEIVANVPTTAPWFITIAAACGTAGVLTVKHLMVEAL